MIDEISEQKLPLEYILDKLKISINENLYRKNIISYEIYAKMQEIIIKDMHKYIKNKR